MTPFAAVCSTKCSVVVAVIKAGDGVWDSISRPRASGLKELPRGAVVHHA
jgi:hypothetical protein